MNEPHHDGSLLNVLGLFSLYKSYRLLDKNYYSFFKYL